jgi:hypothetical protein
MVSDVLLIQNHKFILKYGSGTRNRRELDKAKASLTKSEQELKEAQERYNQY